MLDRFIQAGLRSNRRSAGTWSERAVAAVLGAFAMHVERNANVAGYNVDLLVNERVVVECFGDYWHCNPGLYDADWFNKSLKMTAAAKWQYDAARARELIGRGYRVFIIWEFDLRRRPELVSSIIRKVLHAAH